MKVLSESGEVLIEECKEQEHVIDTLVVGSGYGGAVAALRFAEHGCKVYVLERGDEYVSGEFPNDVSQLGKHVRADILSTTGVHATGNENALFDVRLGAGIGAIVGNGLGGGSLINAAIGLRADPKVFETDRWPAGIRGEDLTPSYQVAEDMLELQQPGEQTDQVPLAFDPARTKKYQRLHEIFLKAKAHHQKKSGHINVAFKPLPMAIQLKGMPSQSHGKRAVCNGCGDCVTGCNYHAKLSLTATYLPKAVQQGARIFTGLTVLHIQENPQFNAEATDHAQAVSCRWIVTYVRTAERGLSEQIQRSNIDSPACREVQAREHWEYRVFAKRVVLSAGTFGSTEILLRSRQAGLNVSKTALGMGFSGNGDDISFAFGLRQPVNGIGNAAYENPNAVKMEAAVGPTASGGIFFDDPLDVTRSSLMEDGAIPSLMRRLFGELTHTLGTVIQLSHLGYRENKTHDHLTVSGHNQKHTLGLLGMGHDSGSGLLLLDAMSNRLALAWPNAHQEKSPILHQMRQAIVRKLGAIFIQNPATGILPEALATHLSGASQQTRLVTVHPLGGCRMGDNVYTGVVNHWGAVFKDDGQTVDQTFDDLYVLDGAIIPSSVGVNPMLTITALAERACKKILLNIPQNRPETVPLNTPDAYPSPLDLCASDDQEVSEARLSEVLRCNHPVLSESFRNLMGISDASQPIPAALFIEMDIHRWDEVLESASHTAPIIPTQQGQNRFTRSRLVIDTVPFGRDASGTPTGMSRELMVLSGKVSLFTLQKQCIPLRLIHALRIALTYLLARWLPDYLKAQTDKAQTDKAQTDKAQTDKAASRPKNHQSLKAIFLNAIKLVWHASEVRTFDYELELAYKNQSFRLIGKKTISAGANWAEIWRVVKQIISHIPKKKIPAILRPSVWEQLTQVQIKIVDTDTTENVLQGRFVMDFPAMMRWFTPQLGSTGDTLNALVKLAGYPLFLFRGILKTRLLDFRLPDYKDDFVSSALPYTDPATLTKPKGSDPYTSLSKQYAFPTLTLKGGYQPAGLVIPLQVKFSPSSGAPDTDLVLIRYRQPMDVLKRGCLASNVDGLFKVKSIILLNGFALTTHAFVATELKDKNLASMLYEQGWDVWLFEYRASPLLDVSAKYSSIDDIARFDIPAALDKVINEVSSELSTCLPAVNNTNLQVYCYSHCVGSASLMMAILGGRLLHHNGQSKLAGILISQFLPYPIGSRSTQVKLKLSGMLRNIFNLDLLQFTAGQEKPNGFYQLIDRLLASFNYHEGNAFDHELCPHEQDTLTKHQPDTTSCKRMTGIFGRSMVHDNLMLETHEKLDLYFGRANVGVFLQGAKCVEYEQLVNMDGQNVYVSDERILKYLTMPVMVVHGEKNVLFDKQSFQLTKLEFDRLLGSQPFKGVENRFLLAKGYAHFDCTVGKNAHEDIFEPAIDFFNQAHHAEPSTAVMDAFYHPSLPLTGPVVGWVREQGEHIVCRVWFEVENDRRGVEDKTVGLTKVTAGNQVSYQLWEVRQQAIRSHQDDSANSEQLFSVYFCIADVLIPKAALAHGTLKVECLSLHKMHAQRNPDMLALHFQGQLEQQNYHIHTRAFHRNVVDQISPVLNVSDPADIDALRKWVSRTERMLIVRKQRASAANPDTLIRRELDLRDWRRCSITLNTPQLISANDNLHFIAAGCRHLGLTGFEFDRSDLTLNTIARYIDAMQPHFMLMLGDQVYVDTRAGVLDNSTLIERLIPKYRQAFNSPGFQAVASRLPIYMTIDDHEIADNWSDEKRYLSKVDLVNQKNAKSAFFVYQRCFGPPKCKTRGGFDYTFKNAGFDFLSLDTRSFKSRVPSRVILKEAQWALLASWLQQQDQQRPKFILMGSVVAPGLIEHDSEPAPRQADNWQMSITERDRLFDLISALGVNNVVFVSSDYHCAATSSISIGNHLQAFSVVAPALHAPMRFANTSGQEVMKKQSFITAGLVPVTINSQAWDGEGWLDIQLDMTGRQLVQHFHLKDFQEAEYHIKAVNYPF